MNSETKTEQLHELIYNIMREQLCINIEKIKSTDELGKLNVDTDDWSFIFIPAIEEKLRIKPSVEEWGRVGTIEEITQLLVSHLQVKSQK